jgi:hypothetical protein
VPESSTWGPLVQLFSDFSYTYVGLVQLFSDFSYVRTKRYIMSKCNNTVTEDIIS